MMRRTAKWFYPFLCLVHPERTFYPQVFLPNGLKFRYASFQLFNFPVLTNNVAVMGITSHQCRQWLRTEYDTAVKRASLAADWQRFEEEKDVLPNLRWVPSTAAEPNAEHMAYWNTVLPISHPFWSQHKPGDRWGCQCSLEATDEPVTNTPTSIDHASPGLDNNPGRDGRIFSESHPYFPGSCQDCPFNKGGGRDGFTNLSKEDCARCTGIEDVLSMLREKKKEQELSPQMMERLQQYWELSKNPNYQHVEFNEENGGIKAIHIEHNKDKHGWPYEEQALIAGFSRGDCVVLESEMGGQNRQRFVEGKWNGLSFEVAGCETATVNNIRNGLKHCASKRITDIAVLVFPDQPFNIETFNEGFRKYTGLRKTGYEQYRKFKHIICVRDSTVIYERDL